MRALAIALTLIAAPAAAQDTERKGPPNDFFAGTYDIVGREIGGAKAYMGTATITDGGERMIVKRCIGDRVTSGYLSFEMIGHDDQSYLSGLLEDDVKAGCEYAVDNGNYAHLACYLMPPGERQVETHGLEFYVIAQNAGADGPDACTD